MILFFLISLFIFGIIFGSFSSVIIYRLHSKKKGIMCGRSHCPSCNNMLHFFDLIPIFSWLVNKAKCKYCKKKISSIYPLLELSTGFIFSAIGYFLIESNLIYTGNLNEFIKLFFWLSIGFISIIYIFYDLLFLEIHEGVMLTGIGIASLGIVLQTFGLVDIIPSLSLGLNGHLIGNSISSLILLLSLVGFYVIMLKGLNIIWDFIILIYILLSIYAFDKIFIGDASISLFPAVSGLIGAFGIFSFFFLQIFISKGNWLGGGDLRIAILIGLLLGSSLSIPGTFLTYLSGSIIGILFIIYSKIKNKSKEVDTQIPFGPFLAIGFFLAIFLQKDILILLENYF